jgi:acyl dehydratase
VRARWTIAAKRRSRSRPDCGVVEEAVRLENQRGEVIQEGVHAVLLACRNDGGRADTLGETLSLGPPATPEVRLEDDPDAGARQLVAASLAPAEGLDGPSVYLEDLDPGQRFTSPRRTVSEADVVAFAGITGDYAMLHTDEEYSRQSAFGTRVAHGLLGLSLVEGLKRRVGQYAGSGATMTPLALTWSFRKPIVPSDTVQVSWITTDVRMCRGCPDSGWLVEEVTLVNQRAEVVQEGRQVQAIQRRPGVTR